MVRDPHEWRPQAPMHDRQLLVQQSAYENGGRLGEIAQHGEDPATLRVPPPAALHRLSGNRVDQSGCVAAGGDKHDAVVPHKAKGPCEVRRDRAGTARAGCISTGCGTPVRTWRGGRLSSASCPRHNAR